MINKNLFPGIFHFKNLQLVCFCKNHITQIIKHTAKIVKYLRVTVSLTVVKSSSLFLNNLFSLKVVC